MNLNVVNREIPEHTNLNVVNSDAMKQTKDHQEVPDH